MELLLRNSVLEFRIRGEEPKWLSPTLSSFREMLQLLEDWDSYGASIITDEAIAGAAAVLVKLQPPLEAPQPSVVPGSSGSVQLEWHRSGADVDIHISSAGDATAFLSDRGEDFAFETIDQEAAIRLSAILARLASCAETREWAEGSETEDDPAHAHVVGPKIRLLKRRLLFGHHSDR